MSLFDKLASAARQYNAVHSDANRRPKQNGSGLPKQRRMFEEFVAANANARLGDKREELLIMIQKIVDAAFRAGEQKVIDHVERNS
ncbi:TPA: hypothetical protein QDA91_004987 [Burkholderia vietnamiensis]|nr:hypothetical protein [Burkholderia vietnamiensis]